MKKFTWGHGIVIALTLFIGFILYLLFIFPMGKQNSDLVSETYYQDELSYQEVINAKTNADALTAKPKYQQNQKGITIAFPQGIISKEAKIEYYLYRTDDKNKDKTNTVKLSSENTIQIPNTLLEKGNYTLKVKWEQNQKKFQVDYDVVWK